MEEFENQLRSLKEQNAALKEQLATIIDNKQAPSTTSNPAPPTPSVSKVSIKLPPFWADRPAVWFAQIEAQFEISGITADSTKYNYVISQLDTKHAAEIEDIITQPPKTEKYEKVKAELIRRLSSTEEQRIRKLLSDEEIGDRKPSQFLRHLRSLAGTIMQDQSILRQLWLRRLPGHIQAIITAQADLPLDKLADLADKILEVTPIPITPAVYAASAPTSTPTELHVLTTCLEELTRQVAALTERGRGFSRSNSPNRSRSRSRDSRGQNGSQLCWYHRVYKSKAEKCNKPCNWDEQAGNSQGGQ